MYELIQRFTLTLLWNLLLDSRQNKKKEARWQQQQKITKTISNTQINSKQKSNKPTSWNL